ncbi:hypothetical protein PU695_27465 [Klebsiella pneumoniae]|uniref:hypothetical protein n=1 Tax=Klebsiella pneumoniae TaxID=573 RepID=UPI002AF95A94|nr:hypothetical protein [Klebsiella pneumoniae]HBW7975151.1 hypothetical protein [Klebsiella pneumoniae]HBW8672616.1 hypothetical protein [Klebsiella pneumoniae]HBW8706418.1 hypothetical protein [Klebsiella pneumoniae]HEO1538335.1 hypothetical protein [Klebsiella aerogenes]
MHHEFAVESYRAFTEKFGETGDYQFIKNWCLEPEMKAFAIEHCDEKIADIYGTVSGMSGYRKPTDKQKEAIAHAMLTRRTARDILISIYGEKVVTLLKDMDAIDESDEVAAEMFKYGIRLSDKRIAFGLLNEFIPTGPDSLQGNTYRASVRVIALLKDIEEDYDSYVKAGIMVGLISGERIALTAEEMRKTGQKDQDVLRFSNEAMELERYIKLYYRGSHKDFAEAMGVTPSKVSEWKKLGWIVYRGQLWSSKRTLARNDDVMMCKLPDTNQGNGA